MLWGVPAGAQVVGTVRDADSGRPIPGATVTVTDLDLAASTDSLGRYGFHEIPAGPHHLGVRLLGYAPHWMHVLVPRQGEIEVDVSLNPAPVLIRALEVRAPLLLRGLEGGEPVVFPDRRSSIAAIRNHPLLSEPDALQAVAGGEVVVHPESPAGVHVLGGASDQTAYLLDGIPVFSPYHAAGLASAWNPDVLARLDLVSSTHADEYTHTLSGAIDGATREPGDRFAAQGGVSTSQMRLTVDGPLGSGAGYVLSTRSGFAGLVGRLHDPSHLQGETTDWLAKLEGPLLGGRARLLGYGNSNEIGATAVAESATIAVLPRNDFEWHGASVGAEWKRDLPSAQLRLLGWSAQGEAAAGWSRLSAPVDLAASRHDLGLHAAAERHGGGATTSAALTLERSRTWYRVQSDSAGGPAWNLAAITPLATASAGRSQPLGALLAVDVGASLSAVAGDLFPGARAQLKWTPSNRLTLSSGWSRTHQFAQSLRNQESIVSHVFPVDVTVGANAPGIPVASSDLGVLAADLRPGPGIHLGVQAYGRTSDGLVLVAPLDGEPFSTGRFAIGSEDAWGATAEAAFSSARIGVLASYGFQHARLFYGDSSYVPEHALAHSLEGGVVVFPSASTTARVGVSAGWGRRTTIVPGGFEWESCNLLDRGCEFSGSPDYTGERLGATRLPPYCRVDVGLRRHWHLSVARRDATVALFGAFSNVLNRKNLLTYARDPRSGELIGIELRPTSALVAGLDWRF